jgi:hypothetical protein
MKSTKFLFFQEFLFLFHDFEPPRLNPPAADQKMVFNGVNKDAKSTKGFYYCPAGRRDTWPAADGGALRLRFEVGSWRQKN